jgi:hypothetical protein
MKQLEMCKYFKKIQQLFCLLDRMKSTEEKSHPKKHHFYFFFLLKWQSHTVQKQTAHSTFIIKS